MRFCHRVMQTENYEALKACDKRQKRLLAREISVHRLIDTFYNSVKEAIRIIRLGSGLLLTYF